MIPEAIKKSIEFVVHKCINTAAARYKRPFGMPTIVYKKRGTVAGTAHYSKWEIDINPILLLENLDDMINQTVPHEVAHLIAEEVFGTNIRPHGLEWKLVMALFGLKPERCHNYDTTNARVRRKRRFVYACNCFSSCLVGPTVHKRVQKGYLGYSCKRCNQKLNNCAWRKA